MARLADAHRAQVAALAAQQERERLAAGAAAGHDVKAHQPAEYLGAGGWLVGCTCGAKPAKASARHSMRLVWFGQHVKALGLPRFAGVDATYGRAVYMDGPAKGLTWDQAHALGISVNG